MKERSEGEKQIIKAAKHLFLKKGFYQVSTGEIIKEAGVAKGTLYHHFPSKEHLAVAVVEEILNEEMKDLANLKFSSGSPWSLFSEYLFNLGVMARKRESSIMLLFQLTTAITSKDSSLALEKIISDLFGEIAIFGKDFGLTDENVMNVFLALIDGFILHVWLRPNYYTDERMQGFIDTVLSIFSQEVMENQ